MYWVPSYQQKISMDQHYKSVCKCHTVFQWHRQYDCKILICLLQSCWQRGPCVTPSAYSPSCCLLGYPLEWSPTINQQYNSTKWFATQRNELIRSPDEWMHNYSESKHNYLIGTLFPSCFLYLSLALLLMQTWLFIKKFILSIRDSSFTPTCPFVYANIY